MPRTRRSTSARAAKNRWPPTSTEDDEGKRLVLAEEIYWEHVRPFTRTRDLKCLSRRCSTRFAPPECPRCDIREVCTTEFIWKGRGWQILASPNNSFCRKRRRQVRNSVSWSFTKDPGSPDFISGLTSRLEMNAADCAPAYAEARSKWDSHMAATLSPTGRLVESLDMVVMTKECEDCNNPSLSASLLYGEDYRWIDGICLKVIYPRLVSGLWSCVTVYRALSTPLCYYVGHWFEQREYCNDDDEYSEIFDAIESLLDAGADASCFAHCLQEMEVVTWYERPDGSSGIVDGSFKQFYLFEFDQIRNWFCGRRRDDVPILRLMQQTADVFAQSPEYYVGQAIHKIYNTLAAHIDPALLESKGLYTSLPEIQEPSTFIFNFGRVLYEPPLSLPVNDFDF